MVNTFLIGSDFEYTVSHLDPRRKLKQAVEAQQIISIIEKKHIDKDYKGGFYNHPIVHMWYDHLNALKAYYNALIIELQKCSVKLDKLKKIPEEDYEMPWFMSYMPLIYSHRARLYQKDPNF